MTKWHPDTDLDRLLAALGEEIIEASDEDIRVLGGQVGAPLSGIARNMRRRIAEISNGDTEPTPTLADIAVLRELPLRSH